MNDDKPIRIIRVQHNKDYFVMANKTAQDPDLSYEALGVLTYLLSKPDSWEANIRDISKRGSKYQTYKALRELRKAGYVSLKKEAGGRFGKWVYEIFETKQVVQLIENQQVENQQVEIRHTQIVQRKEESTEKNISLPSGKGRKADPEFDVISEVWGIRSGGWVSNMQGMMFGSKKVKGEWLQCQFTPPATIREVADFEAYARKRMAEKNIADLPTAPETIQRWFDDFRNGKANNGKPKVSAARLALEAALRIETPIRRPLDNPPYGGLTDDSD